MHKILVNLTSTRFGTGVASNESGIFLVDGILQYKCNRIFVTIQSTGDAIDFGDLIAQKKSRCCMLLKQEGIIFTLVMQDSSNLAVNNIEYITISTTGNAADFGDLTTSWMVIIMVVEEMQ